MTTVLITGANRGIGLEFAKQYAAEGADVIACCRNPATADALNTLAKGRSSRSWRWTSPRRHRSPR